MLRFNKTRAVAVACGAAVTIVAAPQAMAAGEGTNARLGVRNPSSGNLTVQTQIIASNSNWGTRQSNKGAGGGAIYGCRSAPGAESCVRAVNLMNGLAFSFQSNSGTSPVGSFQVGTTSAVNNNIAPFTTNAGGKVTNLNADNVDGLSASQIESQAVSTAVTEAGTAAKALSSIAAVSATGALQKARGATGSSQTGTATYLVTFGASIANCVYQATVNNGGGVSGFASASDPTSTSVAVSTFSTAGAATPLPFYLTVNC
jgi:hypothetical protein